MGKLYFLLIEIITISIIFCGFCGINPAEESSYCAFKLNNNNTCCYCKHKTKEKYYCLIKKKSNDTDPKGYECSQCSDTLETDYDLPGAPCGDQKYIEENNEDLNKTYCHQNSIDEKHPCCFYDDGNFKGCFGIGKITSDTLYTYTEFLDCFSKYLKINFIILIFFLCY